MTQNTTAMILFGMILSALLMHAQEAPTPSAPQSAATPATHEIHITAQKYKYTPNEIHVTKGQHVKLVLTALDRTHGFKIESLGIERKIEKDKETVVEFDADREGVIPFKCSIVCGLGHRKMKGEIIVEPAPAPQS